MKHQLRFWCTMLLLSVFGAAWAQKTYHLEPVTSVKAGSLYVFEQGGHVMNNTVSDGALQTTATYSTYGLTGNETYVWKLETATGGFYMRNVSLTAANYLNNSSNNVSLSNNQAIWTFNFQTDESVLIQNKNNNYFLGYTNADSYAYKAYSSSTSLETYAHAIKVYKLVETIVVGDKIPIATINGLSPLNVVQDFDFHELVLDATFASGITSEDYTIRYSGWNPDVLTMYMQGSDYVYSTKSSGTSNLTVTITPTNPYLYEPVSQTFTVTVAPAPYRMAFMMSGNNSIMNFTDNGDGTHTLELEVTQQLISQGGGSFAFCIYSPTGYIWGVERENSLITALNCTDIPCVNNESSVNFAMETLGVYTFILDATDESAPTLTVTGFPGPSEYMLNNMVVNKNESGVYSIEITVDEETASSTGGYQFTINVRYGNSIFYYGCPKGEGYSPVITSDNNMNLELLAGESSNYVIHEAGKYTVTFNVDENGVPNSLSVKPFGSASELKGDVNGDGEVDVRDITTLVNIILGKQQ